MADYYKHDKRLHVLTFSKKEAAEVIRRLTELLADVGGGATASVSLHVTNPAVIEVSRDMGLRLCFGIDPEKKE